MYVAMIEVEPLPGCGLCGADVKGGFARCYAVAGDAATAERAMRARLAAAGLRVVEVEWCEGEGDVDWENPDSEEAAACAAEARTSREVVIGRLDTWAEDG